MSHEHDFASANLADLDDKSLGAAYALTLVRANENGGNQLLAEIAAIFKNNHEARTGIIPDPGLIDCRIDFETYSPADLNGALRHFVCLTAAFASTGHHASMMFCSHLVGAITAALESHRGAGHA